MKKFLTYVLALAIGTTSIDAGAQETSLDNAYTQGSELIDAKKVDLEAVLNAPITADSLPGFEGDASELQEYYDSRDPTRLNQAGAEAITDRTATDIRGYSLRTSTVNQEDLAAIFERGEEINADPSAIALDLGVSGSKGECEPIKVHKAGNFYEETCNSGTRITESPRQCIVKMKHNFDITHQYQCETIRVKGNICLQGTAQNCTEPDQVDEVLKTSCGPIYDSGSCTLVKTSSSIITPGNLRAAPTIREKYLATCQSKLNADDKVDVLVYDQVGKEYSCPITLTHNFDTTYKYGCNQIVQGTNVLANGCAAYQPPSCSLSFESSSEIQAALNGVSSVEEKKYIAVCNTEINGHVEGSPFQAGKREIEEKCAIDWTHNFDTLHQYTCSKLQQGSSVIGNGCASFSPSNCSLVQTDQRLIQKALIGVEAVYETTYDARCKSKVNAKVLGSGFDGGRDEIIQKCDITWDHNFDIKHRYSCTKIVQGSTIIGDGCVAYEPRFCVATPSGKKEIQSPLNGQPSVYEETFGMVCDRAISGRVSGTGISGGVTEENHTCEINWQHRFDAVHKFTCSTVKQGSTTLSDGCSSFVSPVCSKLKTGSRQVQAPITGVAAIVEDFYSAECSQQIVPVVTGGSVEGGRVEEVKSCQITWNHNIRTKYKYECTQLNRGGTIIGDGCSNYTTNYCTRRELSRKRVQNAISGIAAVDLLKIEAICDRQISGRVTGSSLTGGIGEANRTCQVSLDHQTETKHKYQCTQIKQGSSVLGDGCSAFSTAYCSRSQISSRQVQVAAPGIPSIVENTLEAVCDRQITGTITGASPIVGKIEKTESCPIPLNHPYSGEYIYQCNTITSITKTTTCNGFGCGGGGGTVPFGVFHEQFGGGDVEITVTTLTDSCSGYQQASCQQLTTVTDTIDSGGLSYNLEEKKNTRRTFKCGGATSSSITGSQVTTRTGAVYSATIATIGAPSSATVSNTGQCGVLERDAQCTQTSQTCSSSSPTARSVNGIIVTLPCWAWNRSYKCIRGNTAAQCVALTGNSACRLAPKHSYQGPQYRHISSTRNETQCNTLKNDGSCTYKNEVCSDASPLTRNVNGVSVNLSCWGWTKNYTCQSGSSAAECVALTGNSSCSVTPSFIFRGTLKEYISSIKNEGQCNYLRDNSQCTNLGDVCTDASPLTRNINGVSINLSCWGWRRDYRCVKDGDGSVCQDLTGTANCDVKAFASYTGVEQRYNSSTRDESLCAGFSTDNRCRQTNQVCIDSNPQTRNVNGVNITQGCWKWRRHYTCEKDPEPGQCNLLTGNSSCRVDPKFTSLGTLYEYKDSVKNEALCIPLDQNVECVEQQDVCKDSTPIARIINGVSISLSCWNWDREYKCKIAGSPDRCQELTGTNSCLVQPKLEYLGEIQEYKDSVRNHSQCAALDSDNTCEEQTEICSDDSPQTRIINGTSITKSCWEWEKTYKCVRGPPAEECLERFGNAQCLVSPKFEYLETIHKYLGSARDETQCNVYSNDGQCQETLDVCTDSSPLDRTVNGIEITLSCWGWTKNYYCKSTILPHECLAETGDPLCRLYVEFKYIGENVDYLGSERDESDCIGINDDETCSAPVETCIDDSPTTRTFNGVEITQSCWQWERNYSCYDKTTHNDCQSLDDNSDCSFERADCLDDPQEGECKIFERVYTCPVPGDEGEEVDEYVCGGDVFCVGGNCQQIEREPSNELKDALVGLNTIAEITKDFDPGAMSLFAGTRFTCSKPIFGLVSCCGGRKNGKISTKEAQEALKGGATAISGLASGILTKLFCKSIDKELDVRDRSGLCHYVGSYCSSKIFGVCTKKKKAYCCFGSKLTRIIQEQGRIQLNKGWDKAKEEQCAGLTPEEFAQLDLGQMDFSDVYAEFLEAAKLPEEAALATELQDKIQLYLQGTDE